MKATLLKKSDFIEVQGIEGKTLEMYIFPRNCAYADRNFVWRIGTTRLSEEMCTLEELQEYNRSMVVLDGEVVLNFNGEESCRLKELDIYDFDGACKTKSFGQFKTLDLIVRKGAVSKLSPVELSPKAETWISKSEPNFEFTTDLLYLVDGYCLVNAKNEDFYIKPGELLVLEGDSGQSLEYSIMGEGKILKASISYNNMENEVFMSKIPVKKTCFDDFKCALFISNVQFRGAKYIFKSLNKLWFDPILTAAIDKVTDLYLTTVVLFLGIILISSLYSYINMSMELLFYLIGMWIILDLVLVSPAIYLIFLPKPVRSHIKQIDQLTPYEKKLREEQLKTNKRLNKLLKKYKYNEHKKQ